MGLVGSDPRQPPLGQSTTDPAVTNNWNRDYNGISVLQCTDGTDNSDIFRKSVKFRGEGHNCQFGPCIGLRSGRYDGNHRLLTCLFGV